MFGGFEGTDLIDTILIGAAAVLAVVATLIIGALAHRKVCQRRYARALVINPPGGIVEEGFIRIAGIEQWIGIRGEDRDNPVLLEIHGGPGASNTIFTPRTRSWEKLFTIVRWDMRGAGKTFGRNGKRGHGDMTLERMLADAIEVADYVRGLLKTDKVILLANSFGSVCGLRLALRRPDLLAAYVGTDQNVRRSGDEEPGYADTLARLRAARKRKDAAALEKMGSDPKRWSARDWGTFAKMMVQSDAPLLNVMKKMLLPSLWFSPQHTLRDLKHFMAGMTSSEQLFLEAVHVDSWNDGTRFEIPFFLFQGEHDILTPVDLAAAYFADVEAPVKEMALIKDATHFASFWQPEQFLTELVTRVRPVVVASERPPRKQTLQPTGAA
jgi:proline iminopeptidase